MPFAIIPERKGEDPIQGTEGGEEQADQRSEDRKSVRLVNKLQGGGRGRDGEIGFLLQPGLW